MAAVLPLSGGLSRSSRVLRTAGRCNKQKREFGKIKFSTFLKEQRIDVKNANFVDMIWHNAKYSLPEKGQEVVIRYKGECSLAIFDAADLTFIVNVGPDIPISKADIYWMESSKGVVKSKKTHVRV